MSEPPPDHTRAWSRVAVICVTHNSESVVSTLLTSLEHHDRGCSVVVVDNGSTSGPPDVGSHQLIALPENVGYGTACNTGAKSLANNPPDYLVFLNPDIELCGPALSDLARAMEQEASAGIASGSVVNLRGERVPAAWGPPSITRLMWNTSGLKWLRLRRVIGRLIPSGALTSSASMVRDRLRVDGFVIGGFMMVRWECFMEVEGFNEGYFLNWEDADICERARQAGWTIWQLPTSPVRHIGGGSSSSASRPDWRKWYREGAALYAAQHFGLLRRVGFSWIIAADQALETWRVRIGR